ELPPLRETEVRAAAALQRLNLARETLDAEENRARTRMGELEHRLSQLEGDIERERRLVADAEAALGRLDTEEQVLRSNAGTETERRANAERDAAAAELLLTEAEGNFSAITSNFAR